MKKMWTFCLLFMCGCASGTDVQPTKKQSFANTTSNYQYWLSTNSEKTFWKSAFSSSRSSHFVEDDCRDYFSGGLGVLRSWYLKERNRGDMRKSYHFCRKMKSNGQISSSSNHKNRLDHFEYGGSGTTGHTNVPMTALPVGIKLIYNHSTNLGQVSRKIINASLLYKEADEIIAGGTTARYASAMFTNRTSDHVETTRCHGGYVITGIRLQYHLGAFDGNVENVSIQCTKLRRTSQ